MIECYSCTVLSTVSLTDFIHCELMRRSSLSLDTCCAEILGSSVLSV